MSGEQKNTGAIAYGWWAQNIEPRGTSAAKALSARLRRAAPVAVLCEPAVMELARALALGPASAERLVELAVLLAEVRENSPERLARRLGGAEPALSQLRFQRLIRAEGGELTDLLRRAIIMADRKCNVAALAADLLYWKSARARWCFDYFAADMPEKQPDTHTEEQAQ